ncbi:MAG: DeoR/GlpR family DNA-binding transcription regulator [Pseudomonadota bacterium]
MTLRKSEIIEIARREGKITVEGLVDHFQVTPQTIRRDLSELADAGQVERVHGGAVLPSTTTNIAYNERRSLNLSSKVDIARECAKHIPNDCAVFLNIGTTTEAVIDELRHHRGLLIITNNLNIATKASSHANNEVIVIGGNLRKSDGGMVGALSREMISQLRFDFAIIGCSALHEEGEILDFDVQEVGVSKAIIARGDTVILAADMSKFDRKAPAKVGSVADVDIVVTNEVPPARFMQLCARSDTKVIVAQKTTALAKPPPSEKTRPSRARA